MVDSRKERIKFNFIKAFLFGKNSDKFENLSGVNNRHEDNK